MAKKWLPSFSKEDIFIKHRDQGSTREHLVRDTRILLRACRYFWPYKWHVVGGLIASLVVSVSTAGTAWLLKPALDDIFINKDAASLILVPVAFIALTLAKGLGRYFQDWCMNYSSLHVVNRLRLELQKRIMNLPMAFFEQMPVGMLTARLGDVSTVNNSLPGIIQIIRQFFTVLGLLVVVFQQNFIMACWASLVLPFAGAPIILFSRVMRSFGRRTSQLGAEGGAVVTEMFSGIREIKGFVSDRTATAADYGLGDKPGEQSKEQPSQTQPEQAEKKADETVSVKQDRTEQVYDSVMEQMIQLNLRRVAVTAMASPLMELIASVGIGLLIWFGGTQVLSGAMTVGEFFAFNAALIMLYNPVKNFNNTSNGIQSALVGLERVFALMDSPMLQPEASGSHKFEKPFVSLEFDHVSLDYGRQLVGNARKVGVHEVEKSFQISRAKLYEDDGESRNALRDVSFTALAGQKIAFVGPSGAGKTSIISLIPRFYEPTEGEIRINGRPLREYNLNSLRSNIATVSQETFLFNLSIRDNITYGWNFSGTPQEREAVIVQAAKAAYADEFIRKLPKGYDTLVGERGSLLSGGQRQRIAIARALLKNAPLLILDEATSSLDSEAERVVQQAMDNLMLNRTTFIIAHRLSTVISADRLIVMDHGRIADMGTHEELLNRCEIYAKLYRTQFRVQEENSVSNVQADAV